MHHQQVKMWLTKEATHLLKQQGQSSSAMSKCSYRNHSPVQEPRTGVMSRVQMQPTMEATHQLECQGKVSPARYKCGTATHKLESQGQALSEVLNATYHGSHSPTEETKTGVVSRVEMQLIKEATDFLESREQALSRTQMQLTLQAAHKP